VPLLLEQLPLQQSLPLVQEALDSRHGPQEPVIVVLQMPLQHALSAEQLLEVLFDRHAHVPLEQIPLQHCWLLPHRCPVGLHFGAAAASPPMPRDASVLPTRAAPINLSALPLETSPLASPLARASKERSLISSLICPIPFYRGTIGTEKER
jgi:hypothetical protein